MKKLNLSQSDQCVLSIVYCTRILYCNVSYFLLIKKRKSENRNENGPIQLCFSFRICTIYQAPLDNYLYEL